MSLEKLVLHFFLLYGRRNRLFLPDLIHRICFLNIAIKDLQDAIRKSVPKEDLALACARVVSRIFCVAEYFGQLPLVRIMCQKYPPHRCSYCQKLPCQCPERRTDYRLEANPDREQIEWSLSQWCQHFNAVYGARNRAKGIDDIVNRLFAETAEVLTLDMRLPTGFGGAEINQIEEEFAKEVADALAWTIAVANFFEIDLEEIVLRRYGKGCWNCGHMPCTCRLFSIVPVEWPQTRAI